MKSEENTSWFSKISTLADATIQAQIHKARVELRERKSDEEGDAVFHAKSLLEDPSYAIHSQGWKDKPHRLGNEHLKQMSLKSSIVSAIILTRQNQVSMYSKLAANGHAKGWRVGIKNEKRLIAEIKNSMRGKVKKAEGVENPSTEDREWDLEQRAKQQLREEHREARQAVEDYIADGGLKEDRPFPSKRWGFDAILRAWVRDSLTYDLYACEVVNTLTGDPHHFSPVDGGTIKYASPALKYSSRDGQISDVELEILYPEKEAQEIERSRITELDDKKIEDGDYRYVQVVKGRVERAFTEEELKIGIRNPTTDIYNNGYGIAELELLVSLVTGYLNAEHYNNSYFTQGFSAKGILHIKENISRRKLESVRIQWQHMLKGSRNSFQTPIFAGTGDVEFLPLVQNHDDIGFENWLRYLTKMICSVYQIDPQELGIGFKEEGGKGGGGMSGDNTDEKIKQSQERGLFPLLRHFQAFLNNNIIAPLDDRFCIEFTGLSSESEEARVKRLEKLAGFAMHLNEVRDELDLHPMPKANELILNAEYLQWHFNERKGLIPSGAVDPEQVAAQQKAAESAKKPTDPTTVNKAYPLKIEYFELDE